MVVVKRLFALQSVQLSILVQERRREIDIRTILTELESDAGESREHPLPVIRIVRTDRQTDHMRVFWFFTILQNGHPSSTLPARAGRSAFGTSAYLRSSSSSYTVTKMDLR